MRGEIGCEGDDVDEDAKGYYKNGAERQCDLGQAMGQAVHVIQL